jgi:hypothetical protein
VADGDLDVNVKDLVQAVRHELEELDQARIAADKAPLFQLSSLELELHFVVEQRRAGQGKIDLKVVALGGDVAHRTEQIHKVTVRFDVAGQADGRQPLGSRAHSQTTAGAAYDISPLDG